MRMLSHQEYEQIRLWMYRNARPLELARWRYHFEGGSAEDVLAALGAYQNSDGGFGHAIDCDNWNPDSTPYNAGQAMNIFRELGLYDPGHPMVAKLLDYLGNTSHFAEGIGWPFTIPSNNEAPHAPWWTYCEENNRQNLYHATGNLAGYILHSADRSSGLYEKTLAIADGMMEHLQRTELLDCHDVGSYCALLDGILAAGLLDRFGGVALTERLIEQVNASIERDPAKWPYYSMRPTQYIDGPQSPFYPGNGAVLALEMDYILSTRHDGAVWDISWAWEEYPKQFAIAERWWQGYWAIRNVLLLKAFGRVE